MSKRLKVVAADLDETKLVNYLVKHLKALPKHGTKVIGLVGGPASGKGTLAKTIAQSLGNAVVLSTDNYLKGDRVYRRKTIENPGKDPINKYDFDFLRQQVESIRNLKRGEKIGIPQYDGVTGIAISKDPNNPPNPNSYSKKVGKVDYLIIEGDFQPLKKHHIDCLVYMDVPDKVRLANRIYRDLKLRGEIDPQLIIDNFNTRQNNQFFPHTQPHKNTADIVIKVKTSPLPIPTATRKFKYRFTILRGDSLKDNP